MPSSTPWRRGCAVSRSWHWGGSPSDRLLEPDQNRMRGAGPRAHLRNEERCEEERVPGQLDDARLVLLLVHTGDMEPGRLEVGAERRVHPVAAVVRLVPLLAAVELG